MTPDTARPFVDIHPPVADALAAGRPVVALESTIITHGMPYPDNGAMAAKVEQIIADAGAVPATIAVVNGRIKIGLSDGERESLAMTGDALTGATVAALLRGLPLRAALREGLAAAMLAIESPEAVPSFTGGNFTQALALVPEAREVA